eukprot:scaffold8248_cov76-Skeletonema_marinoi.AAC.1
MMADLRPDYDRNSAEFPVAMELMDRKPKDLSRKVLKCINSVPAGKRDVFKKFVDRGDGMSVECTKIVIPPEYGGDGAPSYYFRVILLGYENEMIVINASPTNHIVAYGGVAYEGSLQCKWPEKYHKELSLLLMHECMTRIVSGTAKINMGLGLVDEKLVATPKEFVDALAKCIQATCVDMKRWGELIHFQMFLLEWAVKNKASLHKVAGIAGKLGESLEARGHQIQAALVYTECGEHLLAAKHPSAPTLFGYAGLAWKREKNWEKGEALYAAALENMHLQYDPQRYHEGLFSNFVNLWRCWDDGKNPNCQEDLVATLRALIIAAGEPSPSAGYDHNFRTKVPYLRHDLHVASAKCVRSVLASIARESTSVGAMRAAIKKCANPNILQIVSIVVGSAKEERDRTTLNKEAARKQLSRTTRIGILVTCDECGELKDEKLFKRCATVCATVMSVVKKLIGRSIELIARHGATKTKSERVQEKRAKGGVPQCENWQDSTSDLVGLGGAGGSSSDGVSYCYSKEGHRGLSRPLYLDFSPPILTSHHGMYSEVARTIPPG